jgi:hypothetical protein
MALTFAGSVTLAGLVVLQAPRAVDPHKGPRNVVFDANFYVVEGSQSRESTTRVFPEGLLWAYAFKRHSKKVSNRYNQTKKTKRNGQELKSKTEKRPQRTQNKTKIISNLNITLYITPLLKRK